jgi:hypothetical protein
MGGLVDLEASTGTTSPTNFPTVPTVERPSQAGLPYPVDSTPISLKYQYPTHWVANSGGATFPGTPPYPVVGDASGKILQVPVAGPNIVLEAMPFELGIVLEEPPPFVPVTALKLSGPSNRTLLEFG